MSRRQKPPPPRPKNQAYRTALERLDAALERGPELSEEEEKRRNRQELRRIYGLAPGMLEHQEPPEMADNPEENHGS